MRMASKENRETTESKGFWNEGTHVSESNKIVSKVSEHFPGIVEFPNSFLGSEEVREF